jgi:hypothetical protein
LILPSGNWSYELTCRWIAAARASALAQKMSAKAFELRSATALAIAPFAR